MAKKLVEERPKQERSEQEYRAIEVSSGDAAGKMAKQSRKKNRKR